MEIKQRRELLAKIKRDSRPTGERTAPKTVVLPAYLRNALEAARAAESIPARDYQAAVKAAERQRRVREYSETHFKKVSES